MEDLIGYAGGVLSSVSFLPQVIKIWRTRSAEDLSMLTLMLLTCNVSLWLTYGIVINNAPLYITNAVVLAMVLLMVYFKIKFKKNTR